MWPFPVWFNNFFSQSASKQHNRGVTIMRHINLQLTSTDPSPVLCKYIICITHKMVSRSRMCVLLQSLLSTAISRTRTMSSHLTKAQSSTSLRRMTTAGGKVSWTVTRDSFPAIMLNHVYKDNYRSCFVVSNCRNGRTMLWQSSWTYACIVWAKMCQ